MRKRLRRLRRRLRKLRSQIAHLEAAIRNKPRGATTISANGVEFIADFEGFPNKGRPYNDPSGTPNCTIGYGHLIHYGPCTPKDHQRWGQLSQTQARDLLRKDLADYADGVRNLFGPLTQNQFDALVSFAFNNGVGALASSTLRKKILAKAPSGEIRAEFNRWTLAGGTRLPGLIRRRKAEADLYFRR